MAVLVNGPSSVLTLPPPPPWSSPDHRQLHFVRSRILSGNNRVLFKSSRFRTMEEEFPMESFELEVSSSTLFTVELHEDVVYPRIRTFQHEGAESSDAAKSEVTDDQNRVSDTAVESLDNKNAGSRSSFLSKLGILLGIAAVVTLVLVGVKPPSLGTSTGIQFLQDGSSSTLVSSAGKAFSFHAFGYTVLLPEYAPGWVYFWLLMAAGCGLFISEEALNIWVGVTLARLLTLDGTWQSLVDSFSRNAPYILSTVLWVYWGVCISDMIPFYLGKFFRQSRASDDIRSKLGVGEEKAKEITDTVQRYGNLIGFVERFSLGVRNPTAFLAGAMNVSPECFFAGVCCGGLVTLPLQLAIGFFLRERPVFALATVATVVGIWTVFPYALASITALVFYLRRRYSS